MIQGIKPKQYGHIMHFGCYNAFSAFMPNNVFRYGKNTLLKCGVAIIITNSIALLLDISAYLSDTAHCHNY